MRYDEIFCFSYLFSVSRVVIGVSSKVVLSVGVLSVGVRVSSVSVCISPVSSSSCAALVVSGLRRAVPGLERVT